MVYIPCVIVGEVLEGGERFVTEGDERNFEDLMTLYTTNAHIVKEFAVHLSNSLLFPQKEKRD